jgi:hypothetical protein
MTHLAQNRLSLDATLKAITGCLYDKDDNSKIQ